MLIDLEQPTKAPMTIAMAEQLSTLSHHKFIQLYARPYLLQTHGCPSHGWLIAEELIARVEQASSTESDLCDIITNVSQRERHAKAAAAFWHILWIITFAVALAALAALYQ